MDIDLLVPRRKPVGPVKINKKHFMGQGINACWLFQDCDGEGIIDLTGRQEPGTLAGATFGRNAEGNRVLITGDSALATVPNYDHQPIGSCIVKLLRTSDDGSRMRVFGFNDGFEFIINDSDKFGNDLYKEGTGTTSSVGASTNAWWTVICTWDSLNGGGGRVAVKRQLGGDFVYTFGTGHTDTPPDDHPTLTIGNRTGAATGQAFKGEIEYIVFKDYVVNRSETTQWALNPYQFLEPAYDNYPLFFPTPAVGGTINQTIFTNYYEHLLSGHD